MNKNNKKGNSLILILGVLFIISIFINFMPSKAKPEEMTYPDFVSAVEDGKVDSVAIDLNSSKFSFSDKDGTMYTTDNPKTKEFKEFLLLNDVKVEEVDNTILATIIASILQLGMYVILFSLMFKLMIPNQQTKEELVGQLPKVTFNDIAGAKELKKDLQYVIEYLKNPKRYEEMGARMPKGIILYGPPGTGKTLTAKAIAGTAGVPFFSMSGSDFVEMYVGLGAKRVRELYKKAKQKAPCIVFIDELDAIGGNRSSATNHSENTQTINALLSELDGFSGLEGVLTIAATNLPANLDSALVRPGRFDKQLAVPMPDKNDRLEILKVHAKGKKISDDIDWEEIAALTVGFSGAGIESMLNEAAFLAVNEEKPCVDKDCIDHAFYKIVMKGDKKTNQSQRDKEELKICAWHEASHAFATKIYSSDKVNKVTIVASTSGAGGTTFQNPKEMSLLSKKYIEGMIKRMYAGRAGEHIYFGNYDSITTGASSDIQKATELIKEYISTYGMDEKYGLLNLDVFQAMDKQQLIEQAASISHRLYSEVEADIIKHKDVIEDIATQLLKDETISESTLDSILKRHNIEFGVDV